MSFACFVLTQHPPRRLPKRATQMTDLSLTLEVDKVAPFLIKLFEIVSAPSSDELVCWSEHGETFLIVDRTKFAQARR